jgi:hypothetical protein
MVQCASCGTQVGAAGEWIEVEHHHEHMDFESVFCGTDCAVSYLSDGLSA